VSCPFCIEPCKNEHCQYQQEKDKIELEKKIRGLEKENARLIETIKKLQNFLNKK
jgi:hypothetical protein